MSENPASPSGLDKKKEGSNEKAWWQPALILFFRFSAWIAGPVLIGALIGNWIDDKYNQGKSFYIFFIIGFSFVISMFGLIREVGNEYRRIEEDEKKNQKKS